MTITYALNVHWTGTTDSSDESGRLKRFALDRGRDKTIGAPGSGFESAQIGKLILDLDNYDGRYDPWNASGALYGNIQPGREVGFTCTYNAVTYDLFTGHVADIEQSGYRDIVTMTVEDGAGWLNSRNPNIALLSSTDVGGAIAEILTDLDYPFATSIESGVDNLSYYWTSGKNGLSEIHDLANADLGRFCVDADGTAHFRSRHNADAIARVITQDQIGKDIFIPMPWDYSRYAVDIYSYPRQVGSTDSTLFTLRGNVEVPSGESITYWCTYKYNDQYVPADGVFVDSAAYSPSTAVASSDASATFFSREAKFEIANPSTGTLTIESLVIKGTPIYSPDPVRFRKESTDMTIPATFVMDYEWLTNVNTGESFADILLDYLSNPKEFPEFTIFNQPNIACPIDLEERLRLDLDLFGIDETFFVNKISHQSGSSLQELITKIKVNPMIQDQSNDVLILSSTDYGILDTNELGF